MKAFFKSLLSIATIISFAACSSEDFIEQIEPIGQDGLYEYNLIFDCDPVGFDAETRASSWKNGDVVYLNFGNAYGTATYSNGGWTIKTNTSIQTTSTPKAIDALYVINEMSISGTLVNTNEYSISYYGEGEYTVSSNTVYVKVVLSPFPWRLRFRGSYGTTLSLPGVENEIYYICLIRHLE